MMRANFVLAAALVCVLSAGNGLCADDNVAIRDPRVFLEQFDNAYRTGDWAGMEGIVRRGFPMVSEVVLQLAGEGMRRIARGEDGSAHLPWAEAAAEVYGKVYGRKGLAALVQRYKTYNKEMIVNWEKGQRFTSEGINSAKSGRYDEALAACLEALKIFRDLGDLSGEAAVLGNIGTVHYAKGRYAEAVFHYDQSWKIFRDLGALSGIANALTNIGTIHMALQDRYAEAAVSHYEQALKIYRILDDLSGEAIPLANLGNIYSLQGRHAMALSNYDQLLKIGEALDDPYLKATALHNIGNVYKAQSRYAEALSNYEQSRKIYHDLDRLSGEAGALFNIGGVHYAQGRPEESLRFFQESIVLSEKIGDLEVVWKSHKGEGKSLWFLGRGEEAVPHYRKSVEAIEDMYRNTEGFREEERSSMMEGKAIVYREFLELLLELHKKSPGKGYDRDAFVVSERGKSRVYQEMLAKTGARLSLSGDAAFRAAVAREQSLVRESGSLRQALSKEYGKPPQARSEEGIASIKKRLEEVEAELRAHEKRMEEAYPRYADLKRPKPMTVEELQGLLQGGETVLSYGVGETWTAAFVVDKEKFVLVPLEVGRKELGSLVEKFRQGLTGIREKEWIQDLRKFLPESSHALYAKVFASVEGALGTPGVLYISGDDVLHTVPFEALVDRKVEEKVFLKKRSLGQSGEGPFLGEYGTVHYLVDRYSMSYLPSASVLRSLRKFGKEGYGKWDRPLVAFADPVFGPEAGPVPGGESKGPTRGMSRETAMSLEILTRSTGGEGSLRRLVDSGEEASTIAKAVGGKAEDLYLRENATEANAFLPKLKGSRYVLFSTHGLLGGQFKGVSEPSLVLTLVGNPPGRDGFLSMSEVLGLDLHAELVILSACNTSGRGDQAGAGEGFAGLTRSFMYAGGKSLLVTHWEVDSEAARNLMTKTMGLMEKAGKASALRESKGEVKGSVRKSGTREISRSHPYFWAPFVLVGEGR